MKKIISVLLICALAVGMTACGGAGGGAANGSGQASGETPAAPEDNADGSEAATPEEASTEAASSGEKKHLVISYQNGIAFAPVFVMKNNDLISKHYNGDVDVEWSILNSGSAINEGIIAGSIDIGYVGIAPAVTGIKVGIPYKIFSGVSSQPYRVMSAVESIKKLSDISPQDKIGVVALNSLPHILFSMACKSELGDAHALDTNLVAMSNADGMAAMASGSLQCHMTISPYTYMEAELDNVDYLDVPESVWPVGDTSIVGVAGNSFHDEEPELYEAVCSALAEAVDMVNADAAETAKMIASDLDSTEEEIVGWLNDPNSKYSTETQGVEKLADFMEAEGFLDGERPTHEELFFDNVKGN